jgi:hypothetical protein
MIGFFHKIVIPGEGPVSIVSFKPQYDGFRPCGRNDKKDMA